MLTRINNAVADQTALSQVAEPAKAWSWTNDLRWPDTIAERDLRVDQSTINPALFPSLLNCWRGSTGA